MGFFTATGDPDAGETFSYSLVGGEGSGDNDLFGIDGNTLRTAKPFDYETGEKHSSFRSWQRTVKSSFTGVAISLSTFSPAYRTKKKPGFLPVIGKPPLYKKSRVSLPE